MTSMKWHSSFRCGRAAALGVIVLGCAACASNSPAQGTPAASGASAASARSSTGTSATSAGGSTDSSPVASSNAMASNASATGQGGAASTTSGATSSGATTGIGSSSTSASGALDDAGTISSSTGSGSSSPPVADAGPCAGAICNAATWNDITANHAVPAWLKKAKLGIGMHFMVSTVPAYHNEWFFQHEYCNSGFATWTSQNFPKASPLSGGPWGYKDFISLFTVAKWSQPAAAHAATTAASWAALFKASGAAFVNATAEHHDRFAMWDSSEPASVGGAGKWNALQMGPKRDVVGELAAAVKAQGMKFGVNNHIMYGYSFAYCGPSGTTPGSVGPNTPASVSDLYDPKYADFYGPPNPGCGALAASGQCSPDQKFCDDWLYRSQELVDKYQLDDEWFDWDGATVPNSPCMNDKLAFALHYYKRAAALGQEVQIMSKGGVFPNMNNGGTGANVSVQDFQSTIPSGAAVPTSPWMSDETISANGSWCYVNPMTYKSPASVISELDSINSKGGVLLLNVSPMSDGTIPPEQVAILNAVGQHLGAAGNF